MAAGVAGHGDDIERPWAGLDPFAIHDPAAGLLDAIVLRREHHRVRPAPEQGIGPGDVVWMVVGQQDRGEVEAMLVTPITKQAMRAQGVAGRLAIMELLRMNSDLDELVARRSTVREIRQLADRQGFETLADDGLRRVLDGSTSIEELGRVVDLTDRM